VSSGLKRFCYPRIFADSFTVLEIGTFIGFSTMGWSDAVGPDGHVTALEFSPEYAAIAEEAFSKNGIKNVDVIVGDATES
jgi:predicted O-methyltransferase YrrM